MNVLPPGMRVETNPTRTQLGASLGRLKLVVDDIREFQGTARKRILDDLVAQNAKLDANTAKLEGLCKAVNAMAERLERGPASGAKDDPVPVRLISQGPATLATVEWRARVTQGVVNPGTHVRDQDGCVAHVCSMITQGDGVTRLFVDMVADGEA